MAKIKQQVLPRAVQEAADRADAILKKQQDEMTSPDSLAVAVAPSQVQPPQPEVKVEAAPVVPEPAPQPVVDKTQTVEYWEHRFKTMQGISESQKDRDRQTIAELKAEVKKVTDKLAETIKAVPVEYDIRKYFSEQEIELHGEDHFKNLLKVAAKISREQASAERETIQREIAETVEPIKQELDKTRELASNQRVENFWTHLNREVPNWQQINGDNKFHTWLTEVEPYYNSTRQNLLSDAEKALDGARVIAIFKGYLKTATQAQTATEQKLERMVAPDSIPSSSIPSNEVEFISRGEINKFYNDMKLNRYKNFPKEAEAMERKIQAAYLANRIT